MSIDQRVVGACLVADGAGDASGAGDGMGASAGGDAGASAGGGCSESLKEDIEYDKDNQFEFTPEDKYMLELF